MKIIITPDSFKESLTSLEVANAIEKGFKKIYPNSKYIKIPMADGGEGTVQSLVEATQGKIIETKVTAPLGNKIDAFLGISGDGKTAIIEMSAASGLHLVPIEQRNPLKTTSFGTGELIKTALNLGVHKIILGLGGSATNDAGVGMLQALGAKFLNKQGYTIGFGGAELINIKTIDTSNLDPRLNHIEFEVACDVTNPLYGPNGASAIFGSQKGATPEMVKILDTSLKHFSQKIKEQLNLDIGNIAGAGAAGGMGGGLLILPNIELKSGIKIITDMLDLAKYIRHADLVITGEGCMDSQTVKGKTPIGVAQIAKQFNKPVIAIVGSLKEDYEVVYEYGIDAVFPIIREANNLEKTLKSARSNLISTAQNIARLHKLFSSK